MNALEKLKKIREEKKSLLCVGLDTDINKLPQGIGRSVDGILEFNKSIIESTAGYAAAYKINFAFYEQYGVRGFEILKETFGMIPQEIFTIADAKRGDIGNTSKAYAVSCFDYFGADSVTVNPYMGYDSVSPFLEYKDKMVFLLCLTSNSGSNDFQRLGSSGMPVYRHVYHASSKWAPEDMLGYVIGATHPGELAEIREDIPGRVLLIPGIGAQGGDIEAVIKANAGGPALINVSRSVIYASSGADFAEKAAEKAKYYMDEFNPKYS